jgi:hypothetical protein
MTATTPVLPASSLAAAPAFTSTTPAFTGYTKPL